MYGSISINQGRSYLSFNEKSTSKICHQIFTNGAVIISLSLVVMSMCIYFNNSTSLSTILLSRTYSFLSIPEQIQNVSAGELYFYSSNEYGRYTGPYPYLDFAELAEPYKNTTLELFGTLVDSGKYSFLWLLDSWTTTEAGTKLQLYFTDTGTRQVTIHAFDLSGQYYATLFGEVVVKYVKREIRSLTVEDRDKFLDAAHALWEYSTDDGREIYGESYTSIQTFVEVHSEASNDILCDAFHGGTGFLTRHLALTNSFEASLRAVDPSVTLPYWDFSIEGQTIYELNANPSYMMDITPVFSSQWFGSIDADHHIADGRWAHAAMPMASNENTTQNSYGYIRSYWNNNPDPEVTRYPFSICGEEATRKRIPNCNSHFDILNSADLGTLLLLAPGDGHGPMHVHIGGVYGGCAEGYKVFVDKWGYLLDQNLTEDDITAAGYDDPNTFFNKWGTVAQRREMFENSVMGEYYHLYRMLWRSHMCAADQQSALLECPEHCDLDTPFENCTCSVNKLSTGETTWQNVFPCIIGSGNHETVNATWPEEMMIDLVYLVATSSVLEGEMIESASTADIIFWLVHPVIERLLAAKRIPTVTDMAGVDFYKWPVVDGSNETWLTYSYYDLEEGANAYHPEAYTCVGNRPEDFALTVELPFTPAISASGDLDGDGYITNWDFYIALDPNNKDANDYVFDHFSWDHCSNLRADTDAPTPNPTQLVSGGGPAQPVDGDAKGEDVTDAGQTTDASSTSLTLQSSSPSLKPSAATIDQLIEKSFW